MKKELLTSEQLDSTYADEADADKPLGMRLTLLAALVGWGILYGIWRLAHG